MIDFNDYHIVCVDFETYYDDLFSLKNMESLEYITDPRFRVHMMGINTTGNPVDTTVLLSNNIANALANLRQSKPIALLCQNTQFDGLIMSRHFNFTADLYLDTRAMAAGLWPHASASLSAVAERLWPEDPALRKGTELALSKGLTTLPDDVFAAVAEYCRNDVNLTLAVFHRLLPDFPAAELQIIDILTRWCVEPALELDFDLMSRYIPKLDSERRAIVANSGLWRFASNYNLDTKQRAQFIKEFAKELTKGTVREDEREYWLSLKVLNSNKAFAAWFAQNKIPVPLKTTPDNRQIPAFAQNDPEFMAMAKHHPQFNAVWAARGAAKSTQNLTRARKLVQTALAYDGKVPVPLRYNAAHTGRAGGSDGLNMQNLQRNADPDHPDGDLRPGALRRALLAPDGYAVLVCDLSNIEARMLAYLAGHQTLLDIFASGGDPYSWMASKIYNRPINKKDNPFERNVGKCLGADTLVLTQRGAVPIIALRLSDKLWDGIEWVTHGGVCSNGTKQTLTVCGISMTPDHKILCGTEWKEAQYLASDEDTLSLALATGRENLPSQDTYEESDLALPPSLSGATATPPNTASTAITSHPSKLPGATYAPRRRQAASATGAISTPCPTTSTAAGCSTDSLQPFKDATTQTTKITNITDSAAFTLLKNGATTARHFFNTCKRYLGGMTRRLRWTAQTSTAGTNPETYDSYQKPKTPQTGAKSANSKPASLTSKPVYDVLNAGPRNRFTIISDQGPLIAHNCAILSLGYGAGVERFTAMLHSGPMGLPPIHFDDKSMYGRIVSTYRRDNAAVTSLWSWGGIMLELMMSNVDQDWRRILRIQKERAVLPSGLALHYPNLGVSPAGIVYKDRHGLETKMYGAKFVENVTQALATCVIKEAMIRIEARLKPLGGRTVMQVHDEVVAICPLDLADEGLACMMAAMTENPQWCPDLPIAAEGGWAVNYSK